MICATLFRLIMIVTCCRLDLVPMEPCSLFDSRALKVFWCCDARSLVKKLRNTCRSPRSKSMVLSWLTIPEQCLLGCRMPYALSEASGSTS